MTTFKNIVGIKIKYLSADPPAPTVGQVWYNTTTKVVKGAINGAGTWASGGTLNTAATGTKGFGATIGTSQVNGGAPNLTKTEAYNGTAWTELNNLNSGRYAHAAFGIATAGIVTGGQTDGGTGYHVNTESWNGTSWTEVNNLNEGRFKLAAMGLQGAGLATRRL